MSDQDDLLERPLFRYAGHLDTHQRLRLACRYGDMDGVVQALQQGADPSLSDPAGDTAWTAAMWSGNTMALNRLLEKRSAPADLAEQAQALGSHPEVMEVLQTHGLAEPGPEKSWSIEDINQVIEQMEDCREQFGIEEGNDRYWGYVPFLSDVTVFNSEHALPNDVSSALERSDPLRVSLASLVMGSRGVVLFHSENEAPKLLLSPGMAREFAPRLSVPEQEATTPETPAFPKRLRH